MGLLDNILGGGRTQGGGGPSTMTLALMALLAYRTYQGKGRLAGMLGRGADGQPAGGAQTPQDPQLGAGRDQGGLGGLLGGLLGGGAAAGSGASTAGGGLGDLLRGGLGGLLGGAAGSGSAGGFMGAGLNELIGKMQQNGQGDTAQSWISHGPNQQITPDQLEHAVGRDTLETLSTQTGKPYSEVLSELSSDLPRTVDQLTPNGRLPTSDEHATWL